MSWDAIVIGSGFGGAMAALPLVEAGQRVLMVERGGWVARGPDNWHDRGAGLITPHYTRETPYAITAGRRRYQAGLWTCVGGQSVFYGGASYRFRESDFLINPRIGGDSGAEWPIGYDDLEPWYALAEDLLGVSGETSASASEPRRTASFPHPPPPLSASSSRIAEACRRLSMTPSRIPVAISFTGTDSAHGCMRCGTCDGYACAAEAKNDLATGIIPRLMRAGLTLRANTVCVRITHAGGCATGVEYVDRINGMRGRLEAGRVILAAGTLATPHLLLASGVAEMSPASKAVGRYLTRHCNAIVFGGFLRPPNPNREFDKQIAILDHYDAAGCIQQLTPPLGLVRAYLPPGLRSAGAWFVRHSSGLIVIAEDQPRWENGVAIDASVTDRYGLPRLRVRHSYSAPDEQARRILVRAARAILREAGASLTLTHRIETFSHALGTVRMGPDANTAPVDATGAFRGVENLYVTDGSVLPRSAGLNPSLTIAANALRVGFAIARSSPARPGRNLPVIPVELTSISSDRR